VKKTHDYIHHYRGYWSEGGKCRGVSNTREGPKILTFLFDPEWCAARSYISYAHVR
jgi:hypothetical protein